MHSVHVAKKQWQTVQELEGAPEVRRLAVPGGWIYQVACVIAVDDVDDITRVEWSTPVFVPFHGDGT